MRKTNYKIGYKGQLWDGEGRNKNKKTNMWGTSKRQRVGKQEGGYEWTQIVEKMRLVKMHEAKP